ncbi:MAG: tetratricopeptide repeat protein, partial [Candidatus Omnitrophota bacterium]
TAYKQAIKIKPDLPEAHNNLGLIYDTLNKQQEAIALFKQAIAINPDYAEAYNNLSAIYFQNKQYKLAIEYCDKASQLGFTNPILQEALKPYKELAQ